MAFVNLLLSVSEPTGFWPTIIKAFEGGVGSYILAIVLLTLVIRLIWAPFDTFNKKINKKNARIQAKMQPELEKLKAKYGNDKNLLNQKTQELYKRNGFSMGGSCLFMLVFMALNLTIFFTLFSGLNAMADYKISQEYDNLKYNYANVLSLVDSEKAEGDNRMFDSYDKVVFSTIEVDEPAAEGEQTVKVKYLVAKIDDEEIGRVVFKDAKGFERQYEQDKKDEQGNIVMKEDGTPEKETVTISADETISDLIYKYVTEKTTTDGNGEAVADPDYQGKEVVATLEDGTQISLKDAIDVFSGKYVKYCYENAEEKSNFLWIANYWIADSPFKKSVFSYKDFVSEIGSKNVSEQEEVIYTSVMSHVEGRVNGYLILAVLSIGVSFLSMFLSNLGNKKKGEKPPKQPGGKVMMFILPIIMGIFAIFYNSVFAIYLVVSQAISAALAPLENLIIKKWDAHDEKKSEEKAKSVVSYRRK